MLNYNSPGIQEKMFSTIFYKTNAGGIFFLFLVLLTKNRLNGSYQENHEGFGSHALAHAGNDQYAHVVHLLVSGFFRRTERIDGK
jgi:hypothetical protein